VKPDNIIHCLERLVEALNWITQTPTLDVKSAKEWVKEFEEIHPFIDGNGRVGCILFNWIMGKLGDPLPLPKLF
jgi:fido (protein-threonine AMPylation protein)